MLVLIYLLLVGVHPLLSIAPYPYGLIRNASITLPFAVNSDTGYLLEVETCERCLCHAFNDPRVVLFTCTQRTSMDVACQMYYFMPKRDEIDYPQNDSSIYLLQTNQTFEEKDDCCNITTLIERINEKIGTKSNMYSGALRSVVRGDGNAILTIVASSGSGGRKLLRFDKTTLASLPVPFSSSLFSVASHEEKYYFGTDERTLLVYNRSIEPLFYRSPNFPSFITTIRFIPNTDEMLLAVETVGVYICRRDATLRLLIDCSPIPATSSNKLHAIGVVNETAFYAGWDNTGQDIHLYTRDASNVWTKNVDEKITHSDATMDLVVDDCQRVWAVVPRSDRVVIYHRDGSKLATVNVDGSNLFNLLLVENYTMFMSHDSANGLNCIKPDLNCRPVR